MSEPASRPPGSGWMFAAGWALLILLLTMIFGGYLEGQRNPNTLKVLEGQSGPLRLQANRAGHYVAEGRINGSKAEFLLDTGATSVAVPENIAEATGLSPGEPIYLNTANGVTQGRKTRIRRLEIGSFVFNDLAAVILPESDNQVLLGMNALGALDITQRDRTMVLEKN